jgi:hypothetical protein
MKKRIKVFHLPVSAMAKSLQRFKELWKTNPESMELRRKRGVEKRIKNCNKYKDHLWNYFVSDDPGTEITPEYLNRICYHFMNEKRNQGSKWTKLKSFKRFLTKYGFIKWDSERDLYFNCHKIKRLEEIQVETDRRRAEEEAQRIREEAQRAEEKRLRLEQIEADRVQREAQQAQQAEAKRIKTLKNLKEQKVDGLKLLDTLRIERDECNDPTLKPNRDNFIRRIEEILIGYDKQISELEKCEAKLSV